jgi:sulfur carrier protein
MAARLPLHAIAMNVTILLNGEPTDCPVGGTVADLLAARGLRPELVAIEVNKELVARDARAQTVLEDGDRVELVTLVGGG